MTNPNDVAALPLGGAVLGRFGQHPDPIIDYSVEVECIQSMVADYKMSGRAFGDDDKPVTLDEMMRRIWKANGFRVGVVPEALSARRALVECVSEMEPIYAAAIARATGASQ